MINVSFHYFFGQDQPAQAAEHITALTFGEHYMATGDASGRIVVFAQQSQDSPPISRPPTLQDKLIDIFKASPAKTTFKPVLQHQLHNDEFDPTRGCHISGAVTGMRFLNFGDLLLSCNERDVVLSKISESAGNYAFQPRRIFNNVTTEHISDLDVSGDRFIVADELTIRELWIENHHVSSLVLQADAMLERITVCKYHPQQDSMLVFATDSGMISMRDQRDSQKGKQLQMRVECPIMDVYIHKNDIYARTRDQVLVFDVRNSGTAYQQISLSPRFTYNQKTNCRFRLGLLSRPRTWITGYYGGFVQLGNQLGDVVQFKASRRVSPEKHGLRQIKAAQVVKNQEYQLNNYQMNDFQGSCTVCEFDERRSLFGVSSGANLFLYSWSAQ